jgi:hypothetical protein
MTEIGEDFPKLKPVGIEPQIRTIFDFTAEALGQLRLWLEMNPPAIPIKQILGFAQFTAQHSEVLTSQTIGSPVNTYRDLATVGPRLTELPKGKYVLLFGTNYDASGGATGWMTPSVNGAAPNDNDAAVVAPVNPERFNLTRAVVKDLALDDNTITMKYKSTQSAPSFSFRWLIVLKYDNL